MTLAVLFAALVALILLRLAAFWGLVDLSRFAFLLAPFNALAFALRQRLGWRRGPPRLGNEPKEPGLFAYLPNDRRTLAESRAQALLQRFDLHWLHEHSSRTTYRDNLFVIDLLDRLVPPSLLPNSEVRALDVGSQDFRYATALERWLSRAGVDSGRKVSLQGVELDGNVIYRDLRSRADHADAHALLTGNPEVRFRIASFLEVHETGLHVVFCFFPFVLPYALLRWGLPMSEFAPDALFRHAASVLRPGGVLIVVNHTLEERDRQARILTSIPALEILVRAEAQSDLAQCLEVSDERTLVVARVRQTVEGGA